MAMDYKAYDTSIPAQMTLAVGSIFIRLAKLAGYSKEEILVIQGIFNELAFPVVDFNGDVIMLNGTNPSGNPLTVFLNNIANSLMMRMFWRTVYPEYTFADVVAMICYGDDIIASVKPGYSKFNMISYRDFISTYGLTVTSAIKTQELTEYLPLEEIDFLKRKFIYSSDLDADVGPLDEKSIFRSLCHYMKSSTDVNIIMASNIDGALDEWFLYGRKVFDDRRNKLIGVAEKYELTGLCSRLHLTFDERVVEWKVKNRHTWSSVG